METNLPYGKIFLCEVCGKTFGRDDEKNYQNHLAHPPWEKAHFEVGQMVELANRSSLGEPFEKLPHFISSIQYSEGRETVPFAYRGGEEVKLKLHQLYIHTVVYWNPSLNTPSYSKPEDGKPKAMTLYWFAYEDFLSYRNCNSSELIEKGLLPQPSQKTHSWLDRVLKRTG